jgi:hypothetical protein
MGQVKNAPTLHPNKAVLLNSGFERESVVMKGLVSNLNKKRQMLSCSITNRVGKEESLNCKKNHAKLNLNFNKIGCKYYP